MHSKILLLIALLLCGIVHAQEKSFQQHREAILSGTLHQADGFYFGLACTEARTRSAMSEEAAKNKAILLAKENLVCWVITEQIRWPETIPEKVRPSLLTLIARRISTTVTLSKLKCLGVFHDERGWAAVVALPQAEANTISRITFEEAVRLLLDERFLFTSSIPMELLIALRATQGILPEPVDRVPWEGALAAVRWDKPRLMALSRFAGRYPLGTTAAPQDEDYVAGMSAYGCGNLQDAFINFLASVERAWTFDALNMAGNVAHRLGRNDEAVPFLLHAAYLNPASAFPWVHLAFVAKAQGDRSLCERCCQEAEKRTPDTWTLTQLQKLRTP